MNHSPKNIYKALSQVGYTNSEAIFEFIDNSIDAGAKNIKINISKEDLFISDDGCGMDMGKILKSAKIGQSGKTSSALGRYGMGMISATLSLGNNLSIMTKAKDAEILSMLIDYEKILSTNEDQVAIGSANAMEAVAFESHLGSSSGTLMRVSNLKEINLSNAVNGIRKNISETYSHHLRKKVSITVNEVDVEPSKDIYDGSAQIHETTIEYMGSKIQLSYMMPKGVAPKSLNKSRIFYVYREGRLIAKTDLSILNGAQFYGFKGKINYRRSADEHFNTRATKKNTVIEDPEFRMLILKACEPYAKRYKRLTSGMDSQYRRAIKAPTDRKLSAKKINISIPNQQENLDSLLTGESKSSFVIDGKIKVEIILDNTLNTQDLYEASFENESLTLNLNPKHLYFQNVLKHAMDRDSSNRGLIIKLCSRALAECILLQQRGSRFKTTLLDLRKIYFKELHNLTLSYES